MKMMVLNYSSLEDVFGRCVVNKNYKAIIIFATLKDKKDFEEDLFKKYISDCCKTHVVGSLRLTIEKCGTIKFMNGSRLELISLPEKIRGKRCNDVLYDIKVNIYDNNIRHALASIVLPYPYQSDSIYNVYLSNDSSTTDDVNHIELSCSQTENSEELEKFLCSFCVIKEGEYTGKLKSV